MYPANGYHPQERLGHPLQCKTFPPPRVTATAASRAHTIFTVFFKFVIESSGTLAKLRFQNQLLNQHSARFWESL
jgi:hypothetical protein